MQNPLQSSYNERQPSSEGGLSLRIQTLTLARQTVDFIAGPEVVRSVQPDKDAASVMKKVVAAEVEPNNPDPNLSSSNTPIQPPIEGDSNTTIENTSVEFLTQNVYDIHDGLAEQ